MSTAAGAPAWTVGSLSYPDLDDATMRACLRLHRSVWPPKESAEEALARWRASAAESDSPQRSAAVAHLVRADDGSVLAFARSFRRQVTISGAPRTVLALASVCSDPARRGQGLGRAVVRAAWARLGADIDVSLFQTDVPAFYEAMGSRRIANPIAPPPPGQRAFWGVAAMIHPGTAAWPDGVLDLCGPGW